MEDNTLATFFIFGFPTDKKRGIYENWECIK